MKQSIFSSLTTAARIALTAGALALACAGLSFAADAPAAATLGNADCVKCHAKPVAAVEAKGGAHKSVGCQGCHTTNHPPAVKKEALIPACTKCHMGKPHYKLANCGSCHQNPHQPKNISFAKNVTDACVTCHSQQIVKLKESPSKHTALACSFCHDTHGKIPACTQCHKSHGPDIAPADCKKCHQAHAPKAVTYEGDLASKYCAACHGNAMKLLAASKAKHSSIQCVTCHQKKHKMVPKCQDCHGVPHPAGMLAKFAKCGDCHATAHDLNNWGTAAPAKKEAAKPAAPAKPKKK